MFKNRSILVLIISLFFVDELWSRNKIMYDYRGLKGHSLRKKLIATLAHNRLAFHISRYYTSFRSGADFTFQQIGGDVIEDKSGQGSVFFDGSGAIKKINDGKLTPLMLGSIPSKQRHIDFLKKSFDKKDGQKSVGIFTLNEDWECKSAGLSELVKNNEQVKQYRYPTQDMTAPRFIDLVRAVRDLEDRDSANLSVSLVHCKAGRGRSATVVAAYLAHVVYKTGKVATVDQVEAYIVSRRPQVRLGREQKKAVAQFLDELQKSGSFERLCELCRIDVKSRDRAV